MVGKEASIIEAWKEYGSRKALEGVVKQAYKVEEARSNDWLKKISETDPLRTKGVAKEKQYLKQREA
uniref:Uncharacterized protein n=1 Tax=Romanomermis culicivorax TaxID=13658 RepID=A0A915I566_ROMCU